MGWKNQEKGGKSGRMNEYTVYALFLHTGKERTHNAKARKPLQLQGFLGVKNMKFCKTITQK